MLEVIRKTEAKKTYELALLGVLQDSAAEGGSEELSCPWLNICEDVVVPDADSVKTEDILPRTHTGQCRQSSAFIGTHLTTTST